jgi:predicted transcriptional regulator
MYEDDEARERRINQRKATARAHEVRQAILDALSDGGDFSASEIRSRFDGAQPLSVIHYHLTVLLEAKEVECVGGLYRRRS